ncbi:sigma-70 family RNA polymerase sigma factor [Flavobacteriales bacterium]|jgi:RNA polymerase sigma-70 factor (ECF subfamily)|nr:sigma-70 family RNA polymerase sigma factor [Flavobacteriales bacterium]
MSENELIKHIQGCKRQDSKSQKWIFERFYRLMFGVCMRYHSDHDRVQDIVQEGFLKVFSNIEGFTSKGSFEGWMKRIMVNTAIDFIRKEKASPEELTAEGTLEFSDDGEEISFLETEEEEITIQHVLAAMKQLTPVYRAVFNLYVFDNLTHQEISQQLGISVGTSKSNLAKARRNVRAVLLGVMNEKVSK